MTRFAGTVLGTAVEGTLLQQGLNRGLSPVQAYHLVFAVVAIVALAGVLLGTQLNEQDNA